MRLCIRPLHPHAHSPPAVSGRTAAVLIARRSPPGIHNSRCRLPIASGALRASRIPLSTPLQRLVFGAPLALSATAAHHQSTSPSRAIVTHSSSLALALALSFSLCTRHAPAHLLTTTARRHTPAVMWRRVYFLLILVRVYFALSPSYLHPDENFQGPEVIAGTCAMRKTPSQTPRNPTDHPQAVSSTIPSTKPGNSPRRIPSAASSRYGSHTAGPCTFCAGCGRALAMTSRRRSSTGHCACSCLP
jgi:hypothetical protein